MCSCHHLDKVMSDDDTKVDSKWARLFIDSANAKISKDFAAKDSVALAASYWPDAEMLLEHMEPVTGNGIVGLWGSLTHMGIATFTFTTTDIKTAPDYIIETGKYEMKDDKSALVDRGKYVVVWQQRNGVWKLYRDTGNTSLPAAK
jgi:ketosteroid isomerase-like protein